MVNKGRFFYYLGIILFFSISLYFTISIILFQQNITKSSNEINVVSGDSALVTNVIDGDEIGVQLNDMKFVVRILGISSFDPNVDDPFTQNISKSTYDYLKSALLNSQVKIVFDEYKKDSKSRLLAYIYKDSSDIGKELISKGLTLVYTRYNFSRMAEYNKIEADAKMHKEGLWSNEEITKRSLLLKSVWETEKLGAE